MKSRPVLSAAALVLGTMFFSIGLQAVAATSFAWPTSGPPSSNASAPLTTSVNSEGKGGGLILGMTGPQAALIALSGDINAYNGNIQVSGASKYVKTPTLCLGTDCRSVWPAGLSASDFQCATGITNCIKFPGGAMMQWGTSVHDGSRTNHVYFPKAFAGTGYSLNMTDNPISTNDCDIQDMNDKTTTQFSYETGDNDACQGRRYDWTAIGF
jgi:hypothetical protein